MNKLEYLETTNDGRCSMYQCAILIFCRLLGAFHWSFHSLLCVCPSPGLFDSGSIYEDAVRTSDTGEEEPRKTSYPSKRGTADNRTGFYRDDGSEFNRLLISIVLCPNPSPNPLITNIYSNVPVKLKIRFKKIVNLYPI